MLLETIFLALVLGLVAGGKIENLSKNRLRWVCLPLAAFFLEKGGQIFIEHAFVLSSFTVGLIEAVVYGLVILFFYFNRDYKTLWPAALGTVFNGMVILANGGSMPVSPKLGIEIGAQKTLTALKTGKIFAHHIMNQATKISFLGDTIAVGPPWPFPKTISFGDILIDFGIAIFIVVNMKKVNE